MKTFLILAAGLAFAAPAASLAQTSQHGDSVAVRVTYRDLDLGRPADAAIMAQRLRDAALQACGASPFSLREYRQSVEASACYNDSLGRAMGQLNLRAEDGSRAASGRIASN